MKKLIILTCALAGAAATPFLLQAAKTKSKQQKYVRATVQFKELSAALKTNRLLQVTIANDIKREIKNQSRPAVQKLRRQLQSLRNNQQLLTDEIKNLLHRYPNLKGKKG